MLPTEGSTWLLWKLRSNNWLYSPTTPQEAHTWPVLRLVLNNLFVCFLMKVKKTIEVI